MGSCASLLEQGRELITTFQEDESKERPKRSRMISSVLQSSTGQEKPRASSMISYGLPFDSARDLSAKNNYQRRSSCDCVSSGNNDLGNYEKMKNANISSSFFKST